MALSKIFLWLSIFLAGTVIDYAALRLYCVLTPFLLIAFSVPLGSISSLPAAAVLAYCIQAWTIAAFLCNGPLLLLLLKILGAGHQTLKMRRFIVYTCASATLIVWLIAAVALMLADDSSIRSSVFPLHTSFYFSWLPGLVQIFWALDVAFNLKLLAFSMILGILSKIFVAVISAKGRHLQF